MWFAIGTFFFSLGGIIGLFALKEWEGRHNRTVLPALRQRTDVLAFRLKELLAALQTDLEKLPPEIVHVSRIFIHEVALLAAALLRFLALALRRFLLCFCA